MKNLKKTLSVILATTLIIGTVVTVNTATVSAVDNSEDKTYLVLTNDKEALNTAYELSSESENISVTSDNDNVISKLSLSSSDVKELKNTDGVLAVEKDISFSGSSQDEEIEDTDLVLNSLFKDVESDEINQWNLDAIGSTDENFQNKVKIELLDSGVSYSKDIDIKHRVNLIPDDNPNVLYEDFSGHGTSMASVIGAKDNGIGVTGINPNADIYSVRVLDDAVKAPLSRIIEGIRWGIDNNMDIINMSFGTNTNSAILESVIQEADEAGILLISATGNDKNKGVQYPAAYPQVLAVGSMNEENEISDFTSLGEELDVVAPGEKIETTGIFGTIIGTEGTSVATAEVSAVASKILEKDKTKSPDFVKKLIISSAKKIQDNGITTGAVDCNYALEMYDDFSNTYTPTARVQSYSNTTDIETYDTDGFVEGLWRSAQHIELGNEIGKCVTKNNNNLKLIVAGARAADKEDVGGYTKYKGVSALHGMGNYVANIKCIVEFIEACDSEENIGKVYNKTKEMAMKLPEYSKSKKEISDLLYCLKDTQGVNYSSLGVDDVGDNSYERAKYKIIGLGIHMVADTYAHRTQVPRSYYTGHFEQKYFDISGSDFSNDIDNVINAAQDYRFLKKVENKGYRDLWCLTYAVKNGIAEFRDIKLYSDEYYHQNVKSKINQICYAYEDNVDFYSRRYDGAWEACNFVFGFPLNEFSYFDIIPSENEAGTCVKLWDLKTYVARARYDTSELSTEEWNKRTSYPKNVDNN